MASSQPADYHTVYTNAKAGMEGVDKAHVQKIVYEMSKGSKHFMNEQRKNAETEARIVRLKQQYAQLTDAEVAHHTKAMDAQIALLEASRDTSRVWIHVDMDAFYASCEELANPTLKDVPMAVGGIGMISTANYHARKFGVRSAMPGFIGRRLCPQLVFVKPNFERYQAASEVTRTVFRRYDPHFEAGSLDEAFLDVTHFCRRTGVSGAQVATRVRHEVQSEAGVSCSCGIAVNKMLAKICSDINKPNGQFCLVDAAAGGTPGEGGELRAADLAGDLPVRAPPASGAAATTPKRAPLPALLAAAAAAAAPASQAADPLPSPPSRTAASQGRQPHQALPTSPPVPTKGADASSGARTAGAAMPPLAPAPGTSPRLLCAPPSVPFTAASTPALVPARGVPLHTPSPSPSVPITAAAALQPVAIFGGPGAGELPQEHSFATGAEDLLLQEHFAALSNDCVSQDASDDACGWDGMTEGEGELLGEGGDDGVQGGGDGSGSGKLMCSRRAVIMAFVDTLPVRKIPGIGRVTELLLSGVLGIKTCGELLAARGSVSALFSQIQTRFFLEAALGLGATHHAHGPLSSGIGGDGQDGGDGASSSAGDVSDAAGGVRRKGISCERTFAPLRGRKEQADMAAKLVEHLCQDMEEEGIEGSCVTLKLKSTDFRVTTHAKTLPQHIRTPQAMLPHVLALLKDKQRTCQPAGGLELRLMGVRMGSLRKVGKRKIADGVQNPLTRLLLQQQQKQQEQPQELQQQQQQQQNQQEQPQELQQQQQQQQQKEQAQELQQQQHRQQQQEEPQELQQQQQKQQQQQWREQAQELQQQQQQRQQQMQELQQQELQGLAHSVLQEQQHFQLHKPPPHTFFPTRPHHHRHHLSPDKALQPPQRDHPVPAGVPEGEDTNGSSGGDGVSGVCGAAEVPKGCSGVGGVSGGCGAVAFPKGKGASGSSNNNRSGLWTCEACTYAGNPRQMLRCEVCDTRRGYSTADAHAHPNIVRAPAMHALSNAHRALQKSSSGTRSAEQPLETKRPHQLSQQQQQQQQHPFKRKHPQQQHPYPSKQGPQHAPPSHQTQSPQAPVHQLQQHQQAQQQRLKQQPKPKQASITSLLQRSAAAPTGSRPDTKNG